MREEDALIETIKELWEKYKRWDYVAYSVYYQDSSYTSIIQNHTCKDVDLMHYVAEKGYMKAMMYLHSHGCPWDTFTCEVAAKYGMLVCLKYAIENGCPWNRKNVCYQATLHGHLNCLMYACEHGGECDKDTAAVAALNDSTECLEFLYDHGCDWDERVCANAAWAGKLRNLKFAHDRGCPWNATAVKQAMMSGRYDCVRYAIIHGCSVPQTAEACIKDTTPKDVRDLIECRSLLQNLMISSSNLIPS